MTTKDFLGKCISIHGVPEEVGADILRQQINNQYRFNAVRIEEIPGAEADSTCKRWILELEGELYAKQLKGTDLKLEFDEECVTVKCMEPAEFELPQVWISQSVLPQPPQQRTIEQGNLHTTQTMNAGTHITAETAIDDSHTEILVKDIPTGLDKDSLAIMFTSKKLRSCIIEDIDFDEVEMNAVIRFGSPDDVRTVLSNRPIKIKQKDVSVEIYHPTKQCEIIVRGPTDIMEAENEDIFESYFENEKISGGGDVKEIVFRSSDNVFVVKFQDDIVAKRVVERGGHRILSKVVNVELLKHSRSTKSTESNDTRCKIDIAEAGVQQSSYGTQTEILVEDIPPGADDDSLWRVFTSRKLKSCTIEEIDFDEVEMNAVIRFESADNVKTVLNNLPITIKQKEVSVQIYVPKKQCMIIVRGPADIMKAENEDRFESYFENEKRSSGGEIAKIEFRSKDNVFIVTFQDEIVAQRVVKRGGHRILNKDVNVDLLKPSRSTKSTASKDNRITTEGAIRGVQKSIIVDGTQTEILVEDIPPGVDKEQLEDVFSSRKLKSCMVEEIDLDEVEMNAVIRFESSEDVKTVMNNLPIKVKQKELSVQIYVPKKHCVIIVRGPLDIMKEENEDRFEAYFENEKKSDGGDITEIVFRSTDNVFVVTFQDNIVAERVVKRGGHRILSKDVYVELLKPSRSTKSTASKESRSTKDGREIDVKQSHIFDGTLTEILVEDIPPGVDEDTLERSFTSRKLKSCTVEEIDFDAVEMNAVIRFEKPEDVKTVLNNRPIKIKQKEVSVQIYVPKKKCIIIVRGPADIMKAENEDRFEAYFENERKSGGGDITEIVFQSTDNEHVLIVTFEDDIVAQRVVERTGHRLCGKDIDVQLLIPSRSTKTTVCENRKTIKGSHCAVNMNADEPTPVTTIQVRGVNKLSNRELVQWYFENKNKSGGGDIEQLSTDDEDDDVRYIRL
ncbi:hypothetical protein DPMN_148490 [Dreissena polymorpha]|uniref:RRM domain-containing protein n=1 Tax=Dreissena polymorpha TaxID=45954 RepID=A0A9D4FA29_DREPO|nr:hypothetical protein DPMN_148490 [Dreissena polymorpha]